MRVRRGSEFRHALRDGVRGTDGLLILWLSPNGLDTPRLGLIVGRKHGGAVRRNRLKRLLREAFRLAQKRLLIGYDYVCTPRVGVEPRLDACIDSLLRLGVRLSARFQER
ncbi:MAG: ribonuclease P protein component [Phycisphaerae bacterium]|nr:ribonuclease P protein component [Phycisphaerae bacterium]